MTGFTFDPAGRPEKSNLLTLFAAVTDSSAEEVADRYATASALKFKDDLADAIVARLAPIGAEFRRLQAEAAYVDGVLAAGAAAARAIAHDTMTEVRDLVGIGPLGAPNRSNVASHPLQ